MALSKQVAGWTPSQLATAFRLNLLCLPIRHLQATATAITIGIIPTLTAQALAAALAVPGAFSGAFAQALAASFATNPTPLCAMLAQARAAAAAQAGLVMAGAAGQALTMCH